MVAAFRDNERNPQLPFQEWPRKPSPFLHPQTAPGSLVSQSSSQAIRQPLSQKTRQQQRSVHLPSSHRSSHTPSHPFDQRGALGQRRSPQQANPFLPPPPSPVVHTRLQSLPQSQPLHPYLQKPFPSSISLQTQQNASTQPSSKAVLPLAARSRQPHWLKRLIRTQQGTCVMTVTLVAIALGLYGQSVYHQRQWGQYYRTLEHLQMMEQQGATANELMKHTLVEQAEQPNSLMQVPLPGAAVTLQKAPPRTLKSIESLTPPTITLGGDTPTGY
ncbi:MAG: hypothetical protein F6K09_13385 [Merismopedia sp. SIO2A8]|nr:hypothetical protein [Merismopedia sp. SIO2A8]